MRKILRYLLFAVIFLLLLMTVKMFLTKSLQPQTAFAGKPEKQPQAWAHLSEMVRFRTISYDDSNNGIQKIAALNSMYLWMEKNYPLTFKNAKIQRISNSLLLEFQGENTALKPAVFLAHLDVVPVADDEKWTHDPFSGTIANDSIYGRGTLDDKCTAVGMLEAMETQIKKGHKNKRSIYFAFGQDEETGGKSGAAKICEFLIQKNIQAEFICDEGFGVMEGVVPGVKKDVAIIGIAEKGYATAKLWTDIKGGHSSLPKSENSTSVLIRALNRIEQMEMSERFCEPQLQFFNTIAPEASPAYRFLFSNLWITSPLVKMVLRKNKKTAATIRTTHATTILKAGNKDNTLPGHAEAMVNFRILPGESVNDIYRMLVRTVDDERVKISLEPDTIQPSPVSAIHNEAWKIITTTIAQCFDNCISTPGLVLTGTECKNYTRLSPNIYRFIPIRLNNNNIGSIHGANEKIATSNMDEVVRYYELLFEKL